MKVSDFVARWLRLRDVGPVFTLPGGMITPLLDSVAREDGIRWLTVHHEQAAAFAVHAVGLLTGRPAVAMATVGPGAMNLLNGIASSHFDSSPSLFITGQVQTYLQKGDRSVRFMGFQECDIVSIAGPVVKRAWRIRRPDEVPAAMDEALALCLEGRSGPVLIDLPMDVQMAEVTAPPPAEPPPARLPAAPSDDELDDVLTGLVRAQRPLLLVGGGLRAAAAVPELRTLAHRAAVPVVASIMALDALSADDPLRAGMIGMYGNRWANLAVVESDWILVLGSRLDAGQTSADVAAWKAGREVVQVDCDAAELGIRVRGCRTIAADLRSFLPALAARAEEFSFPDRQPWLNRIAWLAGRWPDTAELEGCAGINPNVFVRELSAGSGAAAAFTVDAGQHTWWTAQSIQLTASQRLLAATGLGSMGFALPAGIGAAVAGGEPVVVSVGDGALQINIQELQTLVRHRLPVKVVVFNNRCHGMVRQFQESAFEGRYPATLWGYDTPDFARVAAAYGLASRSVESPGEVRDAVRWLWRDPREPALLEVRIDPATNVYPIVPFGLPITAMESLHRG